MERIELEYRSNAASRCGLAKAAMIFGVIGVVTSILLIGIVPGIVAIILGIVASQKIRRHPEKYFGLGYAKAGLWLGTAAVLVPMGITALLPAPSYPRYSPACGANMRGITQSMNIYAADNGDVYPLLSYAPYRANNSGPLATAVAATSQPAAIHSMFGGPGAQDGSVLASVWLLVLNNYTSPKQYICPSDHFAGPNAADITGPSGQFHINFQKPSQLSYAFAYPYNPDGTTGNWWKNTTDASLPIAADMPPLNGTGTPARKVAPSALPADPHSWNSPNHGGEGQYVGFADGHAEFTRRPDIGQANDNIFSVSGTKSPSEFGGTQPTTAPITIQTPTAPYDIVLVPARNLNTGDI